jgi:DNA gyrase subunit A
MEKVAEKPVMLSQAQAEAIGRLQLIQLVGLEIERLVGDYRGIVEEIEGYEAILRDESLVMDIIREDTFEIKEKYRDARRTEITGDVSQLNMDQLIAAEEVVVTVSHDGYIKRIPVDTYRSQGRGGRGVKGTEAREGDFVEHLFVANTHAYLMFFTNKGRVYMRRVYDIPQMSRTSAGRSIANLLQFQETEKIANVLAVKDLSKEEQFVMFATKKGIVKKTALSAYMNIRTTGIIAIGLENDDELIDVQISSGQDQVLLGTKKGLAIRFVETDVRAMGRPAGGVTGIRFKKEGDEVVGMVVVPHDQPPANCMILTACVNGYGKRTPVEEYRLQGRGGSGVINIDASERNGEVVGMKAVTDADELMLITEKGILIRTRVEEIRETGRNAQGVRLIKLDEGDRLVAMAKIDSEAPVRNGEEGEAKAPPEPKAEGTLGNGDAGPQPS